MKKVKCSVPCNTDMTAEFVSSKWVTSTLCIHRVPLGTPINELLEICYNCPYKIQLDRKKSQTITDKEIIPRSVELTEGTIYQSDAVKLLQTLHENSIDLCILDPAYESLEKYRNIGTTTRLCKRWFPIFPNENYFELFKQLYRVMKNNTFVFVFCDEETRDILLYGEEPFKGHNYGWSKSPIQNSEFFFKKTLIWNKMAIGMGYSFRAQHEFILFMEKRGAHKQFHRKLNDLSTGDVFSIKRVNPKSPLYFPTEKPEALIWKLITIGSNPGDTVLDPFCGSGVVGKMARLAKRKFILGDIDINEAVHRLSSTRTRPGIHNGTNNETETNS